jgi:hypothetical protein
MSNVNKLVGILVLFISLSAHAYPDFIGYGYTSCQTCHFDSHGNGPLTDYGRALFTQEIAARSFWLPKSVSDDMAAEASGFIPGVELPFWIRPSIKYRGLYFKQNPGGQELTEKIAMQRDFNLVFSADDDFRTVLVLNYGLLPHEMDFYGNGKQIDAVSRAHYIRFYPTKKLLAAIGLMDIAYGLRIEDHTAFNREGIGLDMNSQTHGMKLHYIEKDWDVAVHGFAGNMFQEKDDRLAGGAATFEYGILETNRLGASVIQMKNEQVTSSRVGVHDRWGIPDAHGSSVIAELGLKQDKLSTTTTKAPVGTYGLFRAMVNLARGFNIISTIQREQNEIKFSSTEMQRWDFGFLIFPWERTEFRLTSVQLKRFSPATAKPDIWQVQGQLHVSF